MSGTRGGGRDRFEKQQQPPVVAGRTPPHNLDAEAAVLAACMLENEALDTVIETLDHAHFYSDANGLIFQGCVALAEQNTPVDVVTVAEWLRAREQIQRVGGVQYLGRLVEATPSVVNVGEHARIVKEKWRLRKVISACQRYAAEGYGDVGEPQKFIDQAEQAIYDIARTPETTSIHPLKEVLTAAFKELTKATERGDRITGVSTGFTDFDKRTAGLHKGDLMIVAARPGMGKTSFVLNLAANVASQRRLLTPGPQESGYGNQASEQQGHAVALFSLEMPKEQLANRLLCSEARVDLSKLRSGMLGQDDWQKLTAAASVLSTTPVWIDDSPGLTVLELRAKVRRLQAEYQRKQIERPDLPGIGLVVIDYLQLMSGRANVKSREQEISEISRGLKGLAKELRVPVIALSQLNRGVETRGGKDKRPMLADLRECVTGETEVTLGDGQRVRIDELIGKTSPVWSMAAGQRWQRADCETVWRVGTRPVQRICLAGGRSIKATAKHRFFSSRGWSRVGELSPGDRLAVRGDATIEAGSAVAWDEVAAIERCGEEPVYDLSVPGPESWVANGIVSHNSGAIEQDADTIVFIYRDEYYNRDTTEEKGLAELIIAKQRNGPTGTVRVRFMSSCTRFDNLQPGDYNDDEPGEFGY